MSTLTRTNSHGNTRKPQYKDYVSFLGSYAKKDDQKSVTHSDSGVNFSLNGSTNNSSNSVFSDVSESSTTKASSGKPKVKTEMFIQIKDPAEPQHYATQTFHIKKVKTPEESTLTVSEAFKIFEKKDEVDHKTTASTTKKSSIEELSRKFEPKTVQTDSGKPPARRAQSIGEVSKIFENNTLHKPKNFNTVPKPFQAPKPAILSPKPTITAPMFPKFVPEPPASYADSVDSALSSLSMSPSPPQCASPPPLSPPPPPPPLPPVNVVVKSPPSPPKLPPQPLASVTKVPAQGIPVQSNGTIDRNDPRVKKAVYGALRSMYGNYHDQANDYLSTLPKNRVRKDNRLDSIIDSIASQGGLGKLNGRVNPNPEAE
ncbi:uncharacterized protein LOC126737921 [Anthonomus grandis grandis]|uniref:uncharacterized protein LOC126737921 n=1 Tax=Anthonomus grandis grandis TaxID=2921223 RepID=UPI002165D7F3|nr:uncharacterized protein LOC126737921 [Anthonomus grandis grandis]